MRALKATLIPVMLVLLGGCALETGADEEPVQAPPPPPPSVQVAQEEIEFSATAPAVDAPTNPGQTNATTGSGGKPQPDPWKQAEDPSGPKKPQPDPWAPTNPGSIK